MGAALEIRDLARAYGGVRALAGVSLSIAPGEAVGLIGPNGSGKSSLLAVLSGHEAPDAGSVRLDGREVAGLPSHAMARRGVARSFQSARAFERLSVCENIRAARHAAAPLLEAIWQSRAARRAEAEALADLMDRFELTSRAADLPGALTLFELRRMEMARVAAAAPALVLLDEPAAGLPAGEAMRLASLVAAELLPGRTALIVEHRTEVLERLTPRIVALREGRVMADGPAAEVLGAPEIRAVYLGEAA